MCVQQVRIDLNKKEKDIFQLVKEFNAFWLLWEHALQVTKQKLMTYFGAFFGDYFYSLKCVGVERLRFFPFCISVNADGRKIYQGKSSGFSLNNLMMTLSMKVKTLTRN